MLTRQLGRTDTALPVLGLGCMGMSEFYGRSDASDSLRVMQRALELGASHFDTADMYGMGHNEELLGRFLKSERAHVFLASKFGIVRNAADPTQRHIDGRPAYIRQACDASLMRLGVDHIDLYYQHRPDPNVPVEESVGAMAELVKAGKVRYLGLSEVDGDVLKRAHAVHPIAALQSEYSLWSRELETEMLPLCRELGVTLVAYSPLGRGFLSGDYGTGSLESDDFRAHLPRFQDENRAQNQALVTQAQAISQELDCTPAQMALAWVLAQGPEVVAIPGTKRLKYLEENCAAALLQLPPEVLQRLNAIFDPEKVAGARYPVGFAPQARK